MTSRLLDERFLVTSIGQKRENVPCVKHLSIWCVDIEWSDLVFWKGLDSAYKTSHKVLQSTQKSKSLGLVRILRKGFEFWRIQSSVLA